MALKNEQWIVIILVGLLAAGLYFGYITIPGTTIGPNPLPGATNPPSTAGKVNVDKTVTFVVRDELAGSGVDGTALYVYAADGTTLLETCTLSSSKIATSITYPSGTQLWIKYYYDTTIDSYKFWSVTVPQMNAADADSATTNQVTLSTREAGAYTDSLITSTGTTITDALAFNTTGSANDSSTWTYSWYTTTDNTGYPSFHDPLYNIEVGPVLWAVVSGTGYDTVNLNGWDGSFEKGSSMYYYHVLTQDQVSKQKVGNTYTLPGANSFSFGFNAIGYSNATTSYTTVQLNLEMYSSPSYMQQFGAYGPYNFIGPEQTVYLEDI